MGWLYLGQAWERWADYICNTHEKDGLITSGTNMQEMDWLHMGQTWQRWADYIWDYAWEMGWLHLGYAWDRWADYTWDKHARDGLITYGTNIAEMVWLDLGLCMREMGWLYLRQACKIMRYGELWGWFFSFLVHGQLCYTCMVGFFICITRYMCFTSVLHM